MAGAAVLARALALLASLGITPSPITVQHPTFHPATAVSGFVDWTDPHIVLNDDAPEFRDKTGIALAGTIAHEQWHLTHGPDEPSAYAEQLRVMRRLGLLKHVNTSALEHRILDSFLFVATSLTEDQ